MTAVLSWFQQFALVLSGNCKRWQGLMRCARRCAWNCLSLFLSVLFLYSPVFSQDRASSDAAPQVEELSEATVLQILQHVEDPELDISIVDLGLVRSIVCPDTAQAVPQEITVNLILTSPLCPYARELVAAIKAVVTRAFPGMHVRIVVDLDTRWTPALMSPEGKNRFFGKIP